MVLDEFDDVSVRRRVEFILLNQVPYDLVGRRSANRQQNRAFLRSVSDIVGDEVVVHSLRVAGPIFDAGVERRERSMSCHRKIVLSSSPMW